MKTQATAPVQSLPSDWAQQIAMTPFPPSPAIKFMTSQDIAEEVERGRNGRLSMGDKIVGYYMHGRAAAATIFHDQKGQEYVLLHPRPFPFCGVATRVASGSRYEGPMTEDDLDTCTDADPASIMD